MITLTVSHACRHLMVPILEQTKFGEEFKEKLKKGVYSTARDVPSVSGGKVMSGDVTVTNK